jgi:hypothetical protein
MRYTSESPNGWLENRLKNPTAGSTIKWRALMRAKRALRSLLIAMLTATLVSCGVDIPSEQVWKGYYVSGNPFIGYYTGTARYVINGFYIREVYLDGLKKDLQGVVIYYSGSGWGEYQLDNGFVGFVSKDTTGTYATLYTFDPPFFVAFLKKTRKNIPLDYLESDVWKKWTGETAQTDGKTLITEATILNCGSTSCGYSRGSVTGTISGLTYDPNLFSWKGSFSEPAVGRSGESMIVLNPDKNIINMMNCDTDHVDPVKYTDCTYFSAKLG